MKKLSLLVSLLFIAVSSGAAQPSRVYGVSPASVQGGATAFPIVVRGSNFSKNSVVRLNGTNLDTFYVSWNKLKATVPASLVAAAGTLSVRVVRKSYESNAFNMTVSPTPVGSYTWGPLASKLQTFISNQTPLPAGSVRGLTFMLARHGKILYSQGFGNQTIDSVLLIASATKMPSGMTMMALVDEGRLDLDRPISTYLAGYATVPPDKANITVRMLFNHTSGLSEPACLGFPTTGTLQQCTQDILNAPLDFSPGTQFLYGGASMQVAGGIVEAITGESWNAYFSRKIAMPLGLTRFTYGNSNNPRIAGGASSDVGDYTRLLQAYLAGGVYGNSRILSRNSYLEMQTDQKRDLPVAGSPGGTDFPGYSYGWWHSGAGYLQSQPQPQTPGLELSDPGAFGCIPWIDLEHNYTAIILIQSQTGTGRAIWNQIRPLIIEQMQANN